MITNSLRAAAFAAALVLTLLFAMSSGAASAQADNCQPEEVVVRMIPGSDPNWQSVFPDENDPRCRIAAQLGCPNQQDPNGCVAGILDDEGCYIFRPTPQYIAGYVVCYAAAKGVSISDITVGEK